MGSGVTRLSSCLLSAVTLLGATSVPAQTLPGQPTSQAPVSDDVRVHVGVSFALGQPVGEFSSRADQMPGFGFEATVRVGESPFSLGGSWYLHFFSTEATEFGVPGPDGLVRPVTEQSMSLFMV